MADADFYLGAGDRLPVFEVALTDAEGFPIDLTGTTVRLSMRNHDRLTPRIDITAVAYGPAVDGIARVSWGATDTIAAGSYDAEWVVTFADGRQMTFPNDRLLDIRIRARL